MVYDVCFDEYVLQCEVTYLEDEPPAPWATSSDWDAYGSREMEFIVISGQIINEHGVAIDAGRNACAAVAEKYAELIEDDLWRQLQANRQDVA
jgi:hypothetical protein